jgi:hypothetical protein
MGGTTNSQSLRYPYLTETITDASTKNLADDIATALSAQDTKRAAALKRAAVQVARNANQSIPDNTDTLVSFDGEIQDTDNVWVIGTPTRLTIPAGLTGLWWVRAQVLSAGHTSSTTKGQLSIRVSGTTVKRRTYFTATGTIKNQMQVSGLVNVPNAGDFIEVAILHVGGGALNASSIFCEAMRRTQ